MNPNPQEILIKNGRIPDISNPLAIDQFLAACKKGNLSVINAYLDLGIDVNAYGTDQSNALTKATEGKHIEVIKLLLKAGANIENKDGSGDSPLRTSINWGHNAITKELLKLGANPNSCTNDHYTPLTAAITKKNSTALELLIKAGAEVNHKTRSGSPTIAIDNVNESIYLNTLVQNGADVNVKYGDSEGTILHASLLKNSIPVAKQILALNASTTITNKYGWNVQMIALNKQFTDKSLLKQLTSEKISDQQKNVALFFRACEHNKLEDVKSLLATQPELLSSLDYYGRNALVVAAIHNRKDIALYLLSENISLETVDETFWDALAWAAYLKEGDLAHTLIENGFPINDKWGNANALFAAFYRKNDTLFKLLIEKGANIHTKNGEGSSLILLAITNNDITTAEILLQKGANPNIADNRGETLLHKLAGRYSTKPVEAKITKLLLKYGADYSLTDELRSTPYGSAKLYNNTFVKQAIEKFVLAETSHITAPPDIIKKKFTTETICILIQLKQWDKVKELVEAGVNVTETRVQAESPLLFAVKENNFPLAALLIQKGADVNHRAAYETSILTVACYESDVDAGIVNGNPEMVKLLVEAGADVNYNREDALQTVCTNGNMSIAEYLISKGANVNPDGYGYTPLMRASQWGKTEMVDWLIGLDANVNAYDTYGRTALGLAVEKSYEEIAYKLLKAGANPNIAGYEMETPLIFAAKKGNVKLITALIEAGADVHFENEEGASAYSLLSNRKELQNKFKDLLKTKPAEPKINKTKFHFKPKDLRESELFYAIYNYDINLIQHLIHEGADVNLRNYRKDTPLMMAALGGDEEITSLLLQKGADASAQNMFNDTAWAYCMSNMADEKKNIEVLLKKHGGKIDVNQQVDLYRRLDNFAKAINQGDIAQVEKLLLNGTVPVNKLNAYATPFSKALGKRDEDLIYKLLKLGIKPNVTLSAHYGILYHAIQCDASEAVIKILLKDGANANEQRLPGSDTPFILATSQQKTAIVKLLLKHGGDPHLKPNDSRLSAYEVASEELEDQELLDLLRN